MMYFPNKTTKELQAELNQALRPGMTNLYEIPRKPFGYAHLIEKELIIREMIQEGLDTNNNQFWFEVSNRQFERHKNDTRYSDRKINIIKSKTIQFTKEELEYIQDKLSGVNEPIGRDILDKIEKLYEF